MSKKLLSLFAIFALVILMGAGCQKTTVEENNSEIDDLSVLEEEDLTEENDNELILSVEDLGSGQVKFIWNTSNNPEGYRMLHSARKNAENPFWQFVGTNNDEGIFYQVPTGTRFFRVCELLDKKCVNYSNEVELEVK
ncbi:MAG TPA: hypothetical protein P5230_01590 [Candidatus Magasanikbacteria bacterium]|nr:hypothetical protein [Candidatus Magasanikbacteria bacterium]